MSVTTDAVVKNFLHIGSLTKESNPKTRKYWLGSDNGVIVISPESIVAQLENAKTKIQNAKKENKEILVVCEKAMYSDELAKLAEKFKFHYLNSKMPGGFITNFNTLIKRIDSMNEKKKFVQSDSYAKLTKKEQVMIKRELVKVERTYEGVKGLKRKPDLVIVVDGTLTGGLVDELVVAKIDNVVLASTDFGRWRDDDALLMMNMQSYQALDFALHYMFS